MIQMLIGAPSSNSGKTMLACALLAVLKRRGLNPCAFKCGPDYIDPMFHRTVAGIECHNLDLFFMSETRLREHFIRHVSGHGAAVCEGVMGLYDGVGGTKQASSWDIARILNLPVILVIRSAEEWKRFWGKWEETENPPAGLILNDGADMDETDIPVLGRFPHLPEADIPRRHLGLYTAPEISDLQERFERLADTLETCVNLERLCSLCSMRTVRIAAAQDEAFCFSYAETWDTLKLYGAEIVFFSPMYDRELPKDICGLYLPGGYPELYAQTLSQNVTMRSAIADAVRDGMPTVAECGGFLYLGDALRDASGNTFPMTGILPGTGFPAGKLLRFGYASLSAQTDSLLFRRGERFPVHEFHHWESTNPGAALGMEKPISGKTWRCGIVSDTLYAAFPHLYFAGNPILAERFVQAAEKYGKERKNAGKYEAWDKIAEKYGAWDKIAGERYGTGKPVKDDHSAG